MNLSIKIKVLDLIVNLNDAEIYNPLIQQLLEEDKAYKCYMTEEELEAEREAQIARGDAKIWWTTCA